MIWSQDPRIEIGHGVAVQVRRVNGEAIGLAYWHLCLGYRREGWIPFRGPCGWDLLKEQPITVRESLQCRACGHHGFIREGRWVPA